MAEGNSPVAPEGPEPSGSGIGPLAWAWGRVLYYRRAIGDVAVTMVPQVVGVLSNLAISVLIARGLGPVGMGKYALIMSICGFVAQLSDLGIGTTAIRYAARALAAGDEAGHFRMLRWTFRIRIAVTLFNGLVALLFAGSITRTLWHAPDLAPYVRWSLLLGLCYAVANVPAVYFQARRRFTTGATVQLLQTLISLAGIVLLAATHRWSLGAVVGVSIVAAALGSLTLLGLVPRQALIVPAAERESDTGRHPWWRPPKVAGTDDDAESAGVFAGFMVLASIIVSIAMRMDVWIMGALLPQGQVGVYQVAGRFTVPMVVLLSAMNTALLPRASALRDPADLARITMRSARLTSLAGVVGLVWSLVGPPLAPWLFGAEYAAAAGLGTLLCLRYVIALVASPLGLIGYGFGLVRLYWRIHLVQMAVIVLINLWLQPRIGAAGAAWALIAHEVVGSLLVGVLLWRACRRGLAGDAGREESVL